MRVGHRFSRFIRPGLPDVGPGVSRGALRRPLLASAAVIGPPIGILVLALVVVTAAPEPISTRVPFSSELRGLVPFSDDADGTGLSAERRRERTGAPQRAREQRTAAGSRTERRDELLATPGREPLHQPLSAC